MAFAMDIRQWRTVDAFRAHLAQYDPGIAPWANGLVIHHTVSPSIAAWKGRTSMDGLARYYQSLGWSAGPHLFVCAGAKNASDDGIWQLTPLNMPGVHATVCNSSKWGIEVVGYYDRARWSSATAELVYGASAALLAWRHLAVSSASVKGHRECKSPKTCPGSAIDMNVVRAALSAIQQGAADQAHYTADSPILSDARIPQEQWTAAFQRHSTGEYTPFDIAAIVAGYAQQAKAAGVNPDVALAQLAHETDWLSSWWSQRPRRNPAGIGVTGMPGVGVSFNSWITESIPAHLGRLLAYALPVDTGTRQQQRLIGYALDVRPLDSRVRGTAPTLRGLGGSGRWAPSAEYGGALAETANEVMGEHPQPYR